MPFTSEDEEAIFRWKRNFEKLNKQAERKKQAQQLISMSPKHPQRIKFLTTLMHRCDKAYNREITSNDLTKAILDLATSGEAEL